MNNEIVNNQVTELLETINEQVDALREYKDKIPRIEFDLLLGNIRKLYETLRLLQRMNDPFEHLSKPDPVRPDPAAGPVPDPIIRLADKPRPSSRKEAQEEKKAEKENGPDLFAGEEPTFNIRLREARKESPGAEIARPEHLKALISINDKFIFINELFDGNLREYNETIETLNGFKDRKQAFEFYDLVRNKNLWDPAGTAFRKLQEVLEKKFS
jgi:SNF2 family DNA or RNA helicase